MKIQTKLLLVCGGILLLTAAVTSLVSYRQINADLREDLTREAGNIRAMLMATRRVYHQQFLASGLPVNDNTVGFLPAHALSRISRDFSNWTDSGLYFNNVSDRPRNPANQADAFELEAMAWFRDNAAAKERMTEITAADGIRYYHYTTPLRIEEYCLKCHGDRDAAPESISARYADAYDYQLGELRGVMSIKIPMAPSQDHVWSLMRTNLLFSLIGIVSLFLLLGVLINRLVGRRLMALEKTASALAAGDYTQRLQQSGNDEVSSLSVAIDHMADEIEKRDQELRRIAEVTAHHLQEPARRMATYAERLRQHLGDRLDDEEDRLSLAFIGQQARRQQNLLRDVERYLAANQPRGEIRTTDVGKVVAGVLDRLSSRIAEVDAHISVGELPAAWIDYPRLTDLFDVVLDNALLYGAQKSRRRQDGTAVVPAAAPLRITIEGSRQGALVRYRISDNGPGIEAQYRERVFRVFERLSPEGEGTGIGLSIVRRIAESCGGRAFIDATQDGGCSVVIELKLTSKETS